MRMPRDHHVVDPRYIAIPIPPPEQDIEARVVEVQESLDDAPVRCSRPSSSSSTHAGAARGGQRPRADTTESD